MRSPYGEGRLLCSEIRRKFDAYGSVRRGDVCL